MTLSVTLPNPLDPSTANVWGTAINAAINAIVTTINIGISGPIVTPEQHGAAGDGVTDDTAAVQAAINSLAFVSLTQSYKITAALTIPAGALGIALLQGSSIIKSFAGTGETQALFRNASFAAQLAGYKIIGNGTIITPTPSTNTGEIVALWCDDLILSDLNINGWCVGDAILIVGNRVRLSGLKVVGGVTGAGNGGIRFAGGDMFKAVGCHVESGDDALQFVPLAPNGGGGGGAIPGDQSITNSVYVGCTGISGAARFMAAVTTDPGNTSAITMAGQITNSGFSDCHGYGGDRGLIVQNGSSSGNIQVYFDDCSVDMSKFNTAFTEDIKCVRDANNIGGVGTMRVTMKNFRLTNPTGTSQTFNITGTSACPLDYFKMEDIDSPAISTASQVLLLNFVGKAKVRDGIIDMNGMPTGSTVYGVKVSGSTSTSADIDGLEVRNIPAQAAAYHTGFTAGAGNSLINCRGQGGGRLAFVASGASRTVIRDNDATQLAQALLISNAATDTKVLNNLGLTGVQSKTANYTSIAGDILLVATANSFTFTLTGFWVGQQIAVNNNGTGTITVAAASGAVKGTTSLATTVSALYMWDGTNWQTI